MKIENSNLLSMISPPTARSLGFLKFLGVFAVTFVVVSASAQVTSTAEIKSFFVDKDTQALRAKLKEEPPSGVFSSAELHYRLLMALAGTLGDTDAKLDIAQRWMKAAPNDFSAMSTYANALSDAGRAEEAVEVYKKVVPKLQYRQERVRYAGILASEYVKIGNFAAAQKLLNDFKVEENIGQWQNFRGDNPHITWPNLASRWYFQAQCELARATSQWQQAEAMCTKELEFAHASKITAPRLPSPYLRASQIPNSIAGDFFARIRMALVFAEAKKYYSAEQIMRRLRTEATSTDLAQALISAMPPEYGRLMHIGRAHLVPIYDAHAQISFMQHRYQNAYGFAQEALTTALESERGNYGQNTQLAMLTKLRIGLAMGDWANIAKDLAVIDQLTANGSTSQKNVAKLPLFRALLAAEQKNWAQAEALLSAQYQELRVVLGEQHFKVALVQGLRAAVGLRSGVNSAFYMPLLRSSVQTLLSPDTAGQGSADQGENRVLVQQVLQAYMQSAAPEQAADAALAFLVADHLRANTTQRSVQAAAIRRSFNDPKLAALVRELQDLDAQLQTYADRLSVFLNNQTSTTAPEFVALKAHIDAAEVARIEVRKKIDGQYAGYAKLAEPKPASVQAVAQQLKPSELFVSVALAPQSTLLWTIDAGGSVRMHKSDMGAGQIQVLVNKVRQTLDVAGLGNKMPAFDTDSAKALYQQLFAPLLQNSASKPSHLIAAVSGALTQLPMGVLPTNDSGTPVRWLIQDYAITHITSATSWLAIKESTQGVKPASEALIAWGDPSFSRSNALLSGQTRGVRAAMPTAANSDQAAAKDVGAQSAHLRALRYDQIPPLPETRDELLAIASSLNATEKDLILGAAATKNSVLAASASGLLGRKRVIAFATHGLLAGEVPDLTQPALALALQSDNTAQLLPNLLTLDDILGLKIQADWVVLSACNTAGADGANNDGISGLVRGFFYAGAKSVLATHWAVESDSALLLTTEAFKHYQANPQAAKAQSLRHAMLHVMQDVKTAHPAFWAPYALVGDGGR